MKTQCENEKSPQCGHTWDNYHVGQLSYLLLVFNREGDRGAESCGIKYIQDNAMDTVALLAWELTNA